VSCYLGRLLYLPAEDAVGRVMQACGETLVVKLLGEGREVGVMAADCLPYVPRAVRFRPRLVVDHGRRIIDIAEGSLA
jgi:hypothetical protein